MNPTKPGSDKFPTGQRLNVSLAFANNKNRWQRSAARINKIVELLPNTRIITDAPTPKATKSEKRTATLKANKLVTNYWIANSDFKLRKNTINNELSIFQSNGVRYEYAVDTALMNRTMDSFYRIMVNEILGGSEFWSSRFFMNQYIGEAVTDGVTDSFNSAILITEGTSAADKLSILSVEQQLNQPQVYDRINMVNGRVFESMKGLVGEMKAQLRVTLTEGMARGLGIRDLKGIVNNRLGIGMARAERIARTEINNAYRGAYLDEADTLNNDALKDDEWKIMQVHRSALSGTTRPNHAARHGTIHTIQEQKDWWAIGSNAINCLCSTLDVLVNEKTGEILQQDMIDRMLKQKKQWFPTG